MSSGRTAPGTTAGRRAVGLRRSGGMLGAALLMLSAVTAVRAQGPADPNDPTAAAAEPVLGRKSHQVNRDTRAFRYLLGQLGLEPFGGEVDQLWPPEGQPTEVPAQTLLVVFGLVPTDFSPAAVGEFVMNGGSLLIAGDLKDPWFHRGLFNFRVAGWKVRTPDPADRYRGLTECPLIGPPELVDFGHPIVRGLFLPKAKTTWVATNQSSYLEPTWAAGRRRPGDQVIPLRPLLDLPFTSTPENDVAEKRPFAAGLEWSGPALRRRLLLLADHSVFIDEMMLQTDNGNYDFAWNCLEWLAETAEGGRRKVLFYDGGKRHRSFEVPLQPPPLPPLPGLKDPIGLVNRAIVMTEKENIHNRLLLELIPLQRIWQLLALVMTVGLLGFGLYRLHLSRGPTDELGHLFALGGKRPPVWNVIDRRNRLLLEDNNFWEPGRTLARDGLRAVFGRGIEEPTPGGEVRVMPDVVVHATWWGEWALRRRLRRVWSVGFDPAPRRLPRDEFDRLARDIDEVKGAAAAGTLELAPG